MQQKRKASRVSSTLVLVAGIFVAFLVGAGIGGVLAGFFYTVFGKSVPSWIIRFSVTGSVSAAAIAVRSLIKMAKQKEKKEEV